MNYYTSRPSVASDPVKVAVKVAEMPVQSNALNPEWLLGSGLVATAMWLIAQNLNLS
jgi:hypothetical protein